MAETYEFGQFRIEGGRLFRGSEQIKISASAFSILLVLLRNPGKVLSSDAIFEAVWPGSAKSHARAVANAVYELRRALNDPEGTLVKSHFREGYVLTAPRQQRRPSEPSQNREGPGPPRR